MQLVLVYAPEPKGIFLVCLRLQREESHADKLQLLNDPLESKHLCLIILFWSQVRFEVERQREGAQRQMAAMEGTLRETGARCEEAEAQVLHIAQISSKLCVRS